MHSLTSDITNVYSYAHAVLRADTPQGKTAAARSLGQYWDNPQHHINLQNSQLGPALADRPARPERPTLVSPAHVPRRRLGTQQGRIALLHAVAHIEFNAIDLAADMICRFGTSPLIKNENRGAFLSDWVMICTDEARHFIMIHNRLTELGADYGDLPAHDGLWEAALSTKHDITARMAIAPMVLEARGLDVTPAMITKLRSVNDQTSADILQTIYTEEIAHVAAGAHWFHYLAKILKKQPVSLFHSLVKTYFSGDLKPPFNVQARDMAGLFERYYKPLSGSNSTV